jgi:hypothetical protein
MKKIFLSLVMLLSMVSFAQAYSVSFDWDGTGVNSGLQTYEAFQLNSSGPILTTQNATTGVFNEKFTVIVNNGYLDDGLPTPNNTPNPYFNPPNMKVDLDLSGQYVNDSTIFFTGGTARMYEGINEIATFTLNSALISAITGGLLQDLFSMKIDFSFIFDTVNPAYWGAAEQDLVGKDFLLAVVGGRIDRSTITGPDQNNDYLISWAFPGARMEFEAVPEPSTILLLGSGLLGVALLGRRKFFKKS